MKTSDKLTQINIFGLYYEHPSIPHKPIFNYYFFMSKTINTVVKNIR